MEAERPGRLAMSPGVRRSDHRRSTHESARSEAVIKNLATVFGGGLPEVDPPLTSPTGGYAADGARGHGARFRHPRLNETTTSALSDTPSCREEASGTRRGGVEGTSSISIFSNKPVKSAELVTRRKDSAAHRDAGKSRSGFAQFNLQTSEPMRGGSRCGWSCEYRSAQPSSRRCQIAAQNQVRQREGSADAAHTGCPFRAELGRPRTCAYG